MLLGCLLALGGCASEKRLPYEAWRLGFIAPVHMEVWVESGEVDDVAGRHFSGYETGTAAIGYEGDPAGWTANPSEGKGRFVVGAALPKRIEVRWQSLVEPQAYRVTLDIPDAMRRQMLTQGPPDPTHAMLPEDRYYNLVTIGLAPGGWVKVWVSGGVEKAIPMMCVKADVVQGGPHEGKLTFGKRSKYWPLSEHTKSYLETHPVPYDSWKCDKP
ncbi:DUF2931 family protein [Frateuria sp. Soil773]|uniref:DUF2931 family protein n=1 Tax=Frateuria sp. Soil773 TaxID=1736407 RepID=UPI001F319C44|nr:DUF2931 family protein [Frateuria sp. Soil773]